MGKNIKCDSGRGFGEAIFMIPLPLKFSLEKRDNGGLYTVYTPGFSYKCPARRLDSNLNK